jgi:hypothetical protein
MSRRIAGWLSFVFGCAGVLVAGCETERKSALRPKSQDPAVPSAAARDEDDGSGETAPPKGFFRSTRLPGALSSEGAEIEQHLGIQ